MKKVISLISRKKEVFLMSLATMMVSVNASAQANLGEQLLTRSTNEFRGLVSNIVDFIQILTIIGGIAMLVMVVFKIFKGDREAAEKFGYWLAGFVLGFALLSVLENLAGAAV